MNIQVLTTNASVSPKSVDIPVHGAAAGIERQTSARNGIPAETGSSAMSQNAGAVRLQLPARHRS